MSITRTLSLREVREIQNKTENKRKRSGLFNRLADTVPRVNFQCDECKSKLDLGNWGCVSCGSDNSGKGSILSGCKNKHCAHKQVSVFECNKCRSQYIIDEAECRRVNSLETGIGVAIVDANPWDELVSLGLRTLEAEIKDKMEFQETERKKDLEHQAKLHDKSRREELGDGSSDSDDPDGDPFKKWT